MKTDTMRVLADEELDHVVGGDGGINLSGSVPVGPANISFQDIGVSFGSDGIDVDLGGAYARTNSGLSFSTHTYVGLDGSSGSLQSYTSLTG
jgi:hypothetical protein